MVEKKRPYYAARTRAQNNLVISANLKPTNGGVRVTTEFGKNSKQS